MKKLFAALALLGGIAIAQSAITVSCSPCVTGQPITFTGTHAHQKGFSVTVFDSALPINCNVGKSGAWTCWTTADVAGSYNILAYDNGRVIAATSFLVVP